MARGCLPALRLALESFAATPLGTNELLDAKRAIRASASLRLPGLDVPMLKTFLALRASAEAGALLAQDLGIALFAARSPIWVEPLVSVLAKELPPAPTGDEPESDALRDQLFWQATAARVLGQSGDPRAVDPLLAVLLVPQKLALKRGRAR